MHISLNNSKLGDKIPSLNLPPVKTCAAGVPCARGGCYGLKGNFTYPKVKQCMEENLRQFLKDPDGFFQELDRWLNSGDVIYRFFRFFGVGDFVNYDFI